jgi:L-amino acid N-acyltransferase YncA
MSVSSDSGTIRPATDADMGAVAPICGRHVPHGRASFETELPNSAETRRRRNDVADKRLDNMLLQRGLGAEGGAAPSGGVPNSATPYRADG